MTATPRANRGVHDAPREAIDNPDYAPAAELRAALRRFASFTERAARRHELTPRNYELLLFIQAADDSGNPATVSSLREPLQTSQGSVTQLVERAVRNGLIAKTAVPGDGRSAHLHLTPIANNRIARVFAELGPERERLAETISQHL